MNMPSNTSPAEFFEYYCTDARAVAFYEKIMTELESEREETEKAVDMYGTTRAELLACEDTLADFEDTIFSLRESLEQVVEAARDINDIALLKAQLDIIIKHSATNRG